MLGFGGNVMSGNAMSRYAERKIQGHPFPRPYEGDDLFIMGGDFIVGQDGKIYYAFHQTTPERPGVENLLSCLKAKPATQ